MKKEFRSYALGMARKCEDAGFLEKAAELYENSGSNKNAERLCKKLAEKADQLNLYFIAREYYKKAGLNKKFRICNLKLIRELEKLYKKSKSEDILLSIIEAHEKIGNINGISKYISKFEPKNTKNMSVLWRAVYIYRLTGNFKKTKEILQMIAKISARQRDFFELTNALFNLGLWEKAKKSRELYIRELTKQKKFSKAAFISRKYETSASRKYMAIEAEQLIGRSEFKRAAYIYSKLGNFKKAEDVWRMG